MYKYKCKADRQKATAPFEGSPQPAEHHFHMLWPIPRQDQTIQQTHPTPVHAQVCIHSYILSKEVWPFVIMIYVDFSYDWGRRTTPTNL